MRRAIILLSGILAALPTSLSQSAPLSNNNPPGAQYIAPFSTPLSGSVVLSSLTNGSVGIQVSLSRLPSSGVPFWYTINTNPVASNGSCDITGLAFNPFNATGICNASDPARCPIGDLSGKHGMIPGLNFAANYVEPYLSTEVGSAAFAGNRTVVILNSNGTMLACANFTSGGSSSSDSSGGSPGARLVLTAGSAVTALSNIGPGPVFVSALSSTSSSAAPAAAPKDMTTVVVPPPGPGGNLRQPSPAASDTATTAPVPPPGPGGNLRQQPSSVPGSDKMSTITAPPPGPGGNLRQQPSSSSVSNMTTAFAPPPAPGGNILSAGSPVANNQNTSCLTLPSMSSAVPPDTVAASVALISDGCNCTSDAAAAAPPPPPTRLTSTPGVVPGFTPGLNGPAGTVTTTVVNTATVGGPTTTITQSSNSTVTVRIMIPVNGTSPTSSSPAATPVCGTGMRTTLPNGSIATVLVSGTGGPVNATRPPNVIITEMPGGPRVTTISGGPEGTTMTLPRSSVTIWGLSMPKPGHRSRITVPPDSTTTVTLPPDGSMTTVTYTPFVTSTPSPSVRTITVLPSSTSVITVPTSTPSPNVLTVVAGPVGTTVTLPDTIVAVPAGATSIVSVPVVNNLLGQTPTITVLELLGGKNGATTMIPEVSSVVTVPGGETSDITLPASTPGLDVVTLLGGLDGVTTEVPELPLETPGLFDLQTPDIVTEIINPPETTDIVSGPPDVTDLLGDGVKVEVGRFAVVGVAFVMGFVVLVL